MIKKKYLKRMIFVQLKTLKAFFFFSICVLHPVGVMHTWVKFDLLLAKPCPTGRESEPPKKKSTFHACCTFWITTAEFTETHIGNYIYFLTMLCNRDFWKDVPSKRLKFYVNCILRHSQTYTASAFSLCNGRLGCWKPLWLCKALICCRALSHLR